MRTAHTPERMTRFLEILGMHEYYRNGDGCMPARGTVTNIKERGRNRARANRRETRNSAEQKDLPEMERTVQITPPA